MIKGIKLIIKSVLFAELHGLHHMGRSLTGKRSVWRKMIPLQSSITEVIIGMV